MMARNATAQRQACRGYTYLGLLFMVALAGGALSVVGKSWSTAELREREQQLLFIGNEFRRAITSYYDAQEGGSPKRFPESLEDLVEDNRFPTPRRHLRRIYADPMTGKADWGLVLSPDKRIMGIYSQSEGKPMKTAYFKAAEAQFGEAAHYRDWKFAYQQAAPSPDGGGAPGSPPLPVAVAYQDTTVTVALASQPPVEYKPTPPASADDPRLQQACERIYRSDMGTCKGIKSTRGQEKSDECAGFAQNRRDICASGAGQVPPPLPNYFAEP